MGHRPPSLAVDGPSTAIAEQAPRLDRGIAFCQGNSIGRKKDLIISVGELEIPRAAWGAVNGLDVSEAPFDLGSRVGLPVRAGAGHLVAGQRLRDAVRAGVRVFRLVVPAALPVPD